MLYDNDMTNVVSCDSPFHRSGEPFTIEKLRTSIDETVGTGVDVNVLQPGYGWVPCWKSKIYPYEQHVAWLRERYGETPRLLNGYNAENVTGEFVKRCRERGMAVFISLRMNDYHHKNFVDFTKEEFAAYRNRIGRKFELKVSRFYMEHPEWRLDDILVPARGSMDLFEHAEKYRSEIRINHLWNWAIPEVRQAKLNFIAEICENYDIDGFELDFMRHRWLFKQEYPMEERLAIMVDFVRRVRDILDRNTRKGSRCWLSVRVPLLIPDQRVLGVDVKSWFEAGVDMFNLAPEYRMSQQHDLARIHAAVPDAPLYLEVTYATSTIRSDDSRYQQSRNWGPRPGWFWIMATREMYCTAAHLAYSRGARGVTVYNFAYHRGFGSEPPFDVFRLLRDPCLVARQPQHYYLAERDHDGHQVEQEAPAAGLDRTFAMDMAPPSGGWTVDGKLRVAVEPALGTRACEVYTNGSRLERTADASLPYAATQTINPRKLGAWILPKSVVRDGVNHVRIVMPRDGEEELRLCFLDVSIR
jgi:hypothetical protein